MAQSHGSRHEIRVSENYMTAPMTLGRKVAVRSIFCESYMDLLREQRHHSYNLLA